MVCVGKTRTAQRREIAFFAQHSGALFVCRAPNVLLYGIGSSGQCFAGML
jgi:hypothetical protein